MAEMGSRGRLKLGDKEYVMIIIVIALVIII